MVRLACLLSLCWAAGATAAVRCELAPAQAQSARPDGYGRAALRVEHDLPATVRAVALRAVSGGPWMVVEMVAPTGRTGPKTVRLPATSAAQTYVILGLGSPDDDPRESAPLFQAQAAIAWPPDRVNAAAVLHPSVGGIGGSAAAAWPADLKAQVLIVLATGTVLGLFVLPARQVRLRAMLILAIAAGMGAAVAGLLRVTPTVTGRTMHVIDRYEGRSWMTTLTHLAARRTTTARLTLEGPAWCAYGSAEAMAADGTVLRPTDGSVLADTDVVCPLRPGRPQVLLATGPPPQGAPLPATVTLGQAGAGRTLTSDRDTPPAIWIEGDRAVRVGALEAGTPRALDDAALEPLDRLDGGGAEEGLGLLKWWARTARTAEESRLVWLATLDGRTVLYVSDVRRAQ